MTQREVQCAECGTTFTAKSSRARLCSHRCRQRASRNGRTGADAPVVPMRPVVPPSDADSVEAATRAKLVAAGKMDEPMALATIALARRIDTGLDTGAATATALRGLAEALTALLGDTGPMSAVDELRERRRAKRGA